MACDCRCVAEGPQSDPSGMQQTLPGPVRGGAAMSRHRGHPGRHVRQQHGRPARVHVQGRGARLTGQPLLLPQGCRVPAGKNCMPPNKHFFDTEIILIAIFMM